MNNPLRPAMSFLVLLPLTACDLPSDGDDRADDNGDGIGDVADDVADGAGDVADDVADGAGDVADGAADVADDVGDAMDDAGDAIDDMVDDATDDTSDDGDGGHTDDGTVLDPLVALLEDELFEMLECEEILRPSTIARLRDVLHEPSVDLLLALATNPQDLATVVAMGGAEIEGAVVVARNLELLLTSGTAGELLRGGWDGVSCNEAVPLACTAGDEATTVGCNSASATSIEVDLDQCTLGGTVHDGAMRLSRTDVGGASVAFDALAFDEIKVLDGSVAVSLAALDAGGVHATSDQLTYTEHGGPEGGLSCGARLALDELDVALDDGGASIGFAGSRTTTEETLAIETASPLEFTTSCACPVTGSLRVEVPRPLGRAGESATAQVSFGAASDDGVCAAANVQLVGWPTDCGFFDVTGDCSKGATQAVLSSAFTALCAIP